MTIGQNVSEGWCVDRLEDGTFSIYPINDVRKHEVDSEDCWCKPRWDDHILVHNSLDRRETYERGEKNLS